MAMNGIDVSHWQAGIDLTKVPHDFAIVKATEGSRRECWCSGLAARSLGSWTSGGRHGTCVIRTSDRLTASQ